MPVLKKYETKDLYVTQHNMLARSVSNLTQDGQALLMLALAKHDYEGEIGNEIIIANADFIEAIPSYNRQNVTRSLLSAEANLNECRIEFNKAESARFLTGYKLDLGDNDTRLVSWIEECVIRRTDGDSGRITGISLRLNTKLKPLLTGVLKDGNYTRVRFKNVATIIGQKKKMISVGAVALYLHLSSWQGIRNKQGGYTVEIELNELKKITRSTMAEYKDYKKFCLTKVLDLINTCSDLSVRYDEIKKGRKVVAIKFGCGQEVIANTKPKRPRLKPKPRASELPEHLWNWANHNLKLLLDYRKELKVYNSDLDLTTPDVERLTKYYYVTNQAEQCNYWTEVLLERKAKNAVRKAKVKAEKTFGGFLVKELLAYYELFQMDNKGFQAAGHAKVISKDVAMLFATNPGICDALGIEQLHGNVVFNTMSVLKANMLLE